MHLKNEIPQAQIILFFFQIIILQNNFWEYIYL